MVYRHRVAVRPSIRPSVHPFIHPFIRPFVRASVHHHSCVCVVPGVEQENARLKRRGIRGMGLLDTLNRVCSLVREVLLGFRSEAMTDAANGHLLTKWARDKYGVEKEAAESLSIRSESVHASVHKYVRTDIQTVRRMDGRNLVRTHVRTCNGVSQYLSPYFARSADFRRPVKITC
jgi:hypothetical protein